MSHNFDVSLEIVNCDFD